MLMPETIDARLLAPCGVHCLACYAFLRAKKPCRGCLGDEACKPRHCRVCAIKACAATRGAVRCAACEAFPCARIKRLDRSYRTRYRVSPLANGQAVVQSGLDVFLAAEKKRWTCPECGGIISQHDALCSACGRKEGGACGSR